MEPTHLIHDRLFMLYIPEEELHTAVRRMAGEINRDYASAVRPLLLVTLNGAFIFAGELFRQLDGPFEVAFVKLSSYEGVESTGTVSVDVPLTVDVRGRDVLIAEDVVDTGGTIHRLHGLLAERGARSVRTATLVFKPEVYHRRENPLPIEYAGVESEPRFIIGYGLDYDGQGRNLAGIYVLCDE